MLTELETQTCKHFGVCGGCTCRPVDSGPPAPPPYAEQLAVKEALVRHLLAPFEVETWRSILGSPEIWNYRNKMEYAVGVRDWKERELVMGLRQAGKFDRVVDLETCLLMSTDSVQVLKEVREWAKQNNFSGFDRGRQWGDLRYVVIREGKNTGQRMAILIATSSCKNTLTPAIEDLRARLQPLLTTCWLGYTETRSDIARTEEMQLLWGPGHILENVGPVRYRISPYSFFQTNTHGTEQLYQLLQNWASPHPRQTSGGERACLPAGRGEAKRASGALLDLYCGSGGITLSLSSHFDRVVGVDSNGEAILDAQFNATLNQSLNSEFVASDVEEFLKKLPASKLSVQLSAVVVDPPRPGLHPKALHSLLELNPPRLAYVSCNPHTLARDLQSLVPFYRIQSAQALDLFPHTPHVETLVTMEHR